MKLINEGAHPNFLFFFKKKLLKFWPLSRVGEGGVNETNEINEKHSCKAREGVMLPRVWPYTIPSPSTPAVYLPFLPPLAVFSLRRLPPRYRLPSLSASIFTNAELLPTLLKCII